MFTTAIAIGIIALFVVPVGAAELWQRFGRRARRRQALRSQAAELATSRAENARREADTLLWSAMVQRERREATVKRTTARILVFPRTIRYPGETPREAVLRELRTMAGELS